MHRSLHRSDTKELSSLGQQSKLGERRIENNEKMCIRIPHRNYFRWETTKLSEFQREMPAVLRIGCWHRRTDTNDQPINLFPFKFDAAGFFSSDRRFARKNVSNVQFCCSTFFTRTGLHSARTRLSVENVDFMRNVWRLVRHNSNEHRVMCTHIPWSGVHFHGTVARDKYEHIIHHRVLAMNLFTKRTNTGLFIRSSYISRRWSAIFYLFSLFFSFRLLLLQTIFTTLPLPMQKLLVPSLPPLSPTLLSVMLSCSRIYIVAGVVTLSYRRT